MPTSTLPEHRFLHVHQAPRIAILINVIMFDRKCTVELLKSIIKRHANVTQSSVLHENSNIHVHVGDMLFARWARHTVDSHLLKKNCSIFHTLPH